MLGSLKFDGSDNYVAVPDSPLNEIGLGNFTFEAWISGEEADQRTHPIIFSNRGTSSSAGGILFFFHGIWGPSESKMLCLQIDGNNHFLINNGDFDGSILDGECHHVAISRNGGMLSYYVDGALIGTKTPSILGTVSFNSSLWIGKDKSTNNTFNGNISQCRIWNVARTESEIAESKDISLEGTEAGLLAYWEMDNDNSQVVSDKTGQYDGILGESSQDDNLDPAWATDGSAEAVGSSVTQPTTLSLAIGPNPTTGLLNIENPTGQQLEVQLTNELGQLLIRNTISTTASDLDLSNFPSGIYFLVLNYGDQHFTKKVIKQ